MSNLKTCSRCGRQVDEQTKFCPQCGSPEFIFSDNPVNQQPYAPTQQANTPNQQAYTPNQQGYTPTQQAYAPTQQAYAPIQQPYAPDQPSIPYPPQPDNGANAQPPKKKGLQWWHIVLMVVGVVVVVLAVVLVVVSVKDKKDDSSNNAKDDKTVVADADEDKEDEDKEDEDKELTSSAPEKPAETTTKRESSYTKGTITGNVYTNEWADLQFVIPDELSDPGEEYHDTGDETTEFGLFLMEGYYMPIVMVGFEKLPSYEDYSKGEEEYLDYYMPDITMYYDCEPLYDEYLTTNIAGQDYTAFIMSINSGDTEYYQGIFVRKIENYMVMINVTAETEAEIGDLVNMFTPVD